MSWKRKKKESHFRRQHNGLPFYRFHFLFFFFDDRTRNYYRSIIFINSDSYWWKNIFTYTVRLDNENKKHKENDTHALHAIIQLVTEWQTTRYRYTWIHISSSKHVTQIKQIILNILNTNQFNSPSYILSFSFYYFSFILFLLFLIAFIRAIENLFLIGTYEKIDQRSFSRISCSPFMKIKGYSRIYSFRTQRKPILRVMIHSANLFAVSHES